MVPSERRYENITCGDRIVDRVVDADASERRHRVCRISDQKKAFFRPLPHMVNTDRKQLHFVPRIHFCDRTLRHMRERGDRFSERVETLRLNSIKFSFLDHERTLPVVVPIQHDKSATRLEIAERLLVIFPAAADAEPEHIYRDAEFLDVEHS